MHVTLHDVCRKTGFSTATVSRALNGSPLVAEDTRNLVVEAAKELGYQPSHAARMLKLKRADMIAVIFPEIDSGFFTEVLRGIDETASEHSYHLMTAFTHGPDDERNLISRFVWERRVDALILMNLTLPEAYLRDLSLWEHPIVLMDRPVRMDNMYSVSIDNRNGARELTNHLIEHGYRRIAFISGPKGTYDADERLAAFRETMGENGLEVNDRLIWPGQFTEASGRDAVARWLDADNPLPDAIFAANDAMAIGALSLLRERGFRVPRDTALVGFDDIDTAAHLGLTTVHVPMRRMGSIAAQLAVDQISQNKSLTSYRLPVACAVRSSCGCPTGVSSDPAAADKAKREALT